MTNMELISRHVADTGACSIMHHAKQVSTTYNEIIQKGWDIVPDILYYLEEYHGGMHVMMLLMDITKEKPYLPEVKGHWNVQKCREAWIEWGKKQYSPPEEKMYPESYVNELKLRIESLEIIRKAFDYLTSFINPLQKISMKLNLGPKAMWRFLIVLAVLGGITLLLGLAVALLWAVNKIVS